MIFRSNAFSGPTTQVLIIPIPELVVANAATVEPVTKPNPVFTTGIDAHVVSTSAYSSASFALSS